MLLHRARNLLKDLRASVAAEGEPRILCESLTLDGHSTCESTQNQGRAISRPTRVRRALSRCEIQQRGDQTPVAISRYSRPFEGGDEAMTH